jgi:hypothetical protein
MLQAHGPGLAARPASPKTRAAFRIAITAASILFVAGQNVGANTVIAPVSVGGNGLTGGEHVLIDGSGLSGVGAILDQTHTGILWNEDWASWTTAEPNLPFNIDLNLGSEFDLTNVHIWNYSHHNEIYVGRDSKDLNFYLSSDGVTWGGIVQQFQLSQQADPEETVQTSALTGTAQYVRIQIVSAWGGACHGCEAGLGEVRFSTSTVVPEPSAALLIWLGLAGMGCSRKRRRRGPGRSTEI